MKYTNKYHLPQWEEDDRIMRTDFNNAMAALEDGISTAQSAADNAYTPEKRPYAIGSYAGNGETTTVETGFQPRFLIITAQSLTASNNSPINVMVAGPGLMSRALTFHENGFSIRNDFPDTGTYHLNKPQMNQSGIKYHYIAFQ